MAKLLNNKFVVAGLVLAACVVLYLQAVKPALEFFFPENVVTDVIALEDSETLVTYEGSEPTAPRNPERELQFATQQFNLTKIDIGSLRWKENLDRDPFSGTHVENRITTFVSAVAANISAPQEARLPRVSAIVSAPNLKFAVIDGDILEEGDGRGDLFVQRIEDDYIYVVHKSTRQRQRLTVTE